MSDSNSITKELRIGTVKMPALLCALTGLISAMGLAVFGLMESIHQLLQDFVMSEPISMSEPVMIPLELQWGLGFLVSVLTAVFTLMSAGFLRRLMVLLMSLTLVFGFSVACILWDVMWLAHLEIVSLIWTWVCAVVYAAQHKMPCDQDEIVIRKERVELDVNFE